MAKIFLIGLERRMAAQISHALAFERHRIEQKPGDISAPDLTGVDLVFAGGEPAQYLSLLKRVRNDWPALPFVVVTRLPQTSDWLDALEAGATDYCSSPFETHQIRWLIESALPARRVATA